MDNRTFWLGLLGGVLGGAILIGVGYLAIKAYLPAREDDPLSRAKSSFIESGTIVSRASMWEEMLFSRRDREAWPEPVPGVIS
ncbi:MAG: hypothetical protein K2W78_16220 [Xanthobacteraceae bacterium]|nr:hypothetical protein [Xanthobacteraceae bacterium]